MAEGLIKLGNLTLVGKKYNEIKASKPGEKDGGYYILKFSADGTEEICVTTGTSWKNEIESGFTKEYNPDVDLEFCGVYNCTFDLNNDKCASSVLKLRTYSKVNSSPGKAAKEQNPAGKETGAGHSSK